jgi:short-subunit dehydrogenase
VLVNNAGIGMASIVEATPDSTIHEIFETNTFGVFATCRAIIPQMRRQGHGVIVNLTSSAAIGAMPLVAVYTGSKCAVEGFTESPSYELEPFNIKARLVEPGYAPTTRFAANGGPRMEGMIPADYRAFAQSCFQKMANYPTAYCS